MSGQLSGINGENFGLVLVLLFVFGVLYALLTNYMARRGIEDQTVWLVVVGTLATIFGASFLTGIKNALILLACFTASGFPMIVEYVVRVENAKRRDKQAASAVTKGLLDDHDPLA